MPDVFDQIHAEASPSGGDVFDQIYNEQQPRTASNPNMLGPSPTLARVGNEVLGNLGTALKNLPSGIIAFIRHPIETTKTAVGQMDLENPEKSSGLLGLPDVLYRKLQSGDQTPEVIGDIATAALPGATAERAGLAGEALGGVAKAVTRRALNVIPPNAAADVVGLASPRAANAIRVANRIKRGVEAFQKAGEETPNVPVPETRTPPPAGRVPPIVPAETAPTGKTPAEVAREQIQTEAPAPEPFEVGGIPTKEGIAQGQYNKPYGQLNADQRNIVDNLAEKFNSAAKPAGPQLVPPRVNQGNPPSGQDIIRGSSNIPLSQQGQAEAQRLAQATAGQFDKIYTSPLDRAQATSKAVAATNPQAGAPEPTEALTPWYLGGNEGRPTTEVLAKMQDLIQNHPDEVPAGRGPQSTKPGQSFNDFKDEFLGHVKDQVENYEPGQKILNATHYRDTRVLQAWAKAGASADNKIDVPTMMEKGDVKPGDLLHLNPQTMEVKAVSNANEPGIYFARHGATAWNAENGTPNPAESVGAPGPAGGAAQPSSAELARLNAGALPQAASQAAQPGGMFLRNFDLDTMARALRSGLNKGSITKSQVSQVLNGQAQLELLRDQLGLKGRIPPNAAAYLRGKVF